MAVSENKGTDFAELAANMEEFREVLRAMVAGLVAEGFEDEQARTIVTGLFRVMGKDPEEGSA
jgi:uncharacterized membrane protein YebE (DUF533 family)